MHHVAESSAEENRGTIIATLGHAHETKHLQKIEDTHGYTIHWLSNVNHWIGLRENLSGKSPYVIYFMVKKHGKTGEDVPRNQPNPIRPRSSGISPLEMWCHWFKGLLLTGKLYIPSGKHTKSY
jgi:hypothetical protein